LRELLLVKDDVGRFGRERVEVKNANSAWLLIKTLVSTVAGRVRGTTDATAPFL
jgi:hypothetical protein